jgi:small subunit ribosomal protein S17
MAETEENVNEEQAAEAAAAEAEAPEADAPEAEAPEAQLSPKERRRRARSAHSGEARPPRSPEERAAERAEERRRKARSRAQTRARARERRRSAPPAAAPEPAPAAAPSGRAKVRQGVVVSDRADKTITVRVDVARQHRRYGKIVRTSSTLHAHDERGDAHVGDTVRVMETRPVSRTKRWRLLEVLERAR